MELFAHSLRFIYRQWWFSIAILNYQRVYPIILWSISLKLYINIATKSGHDMIYICPCFVYIYILYSVYVYIYTYMYIYSIYIYTVVCIYIYISYTPCLQSHFYISIDLFPIESSTSLGPPPGRSPWLLRQLSSAGPGGNLKMLRTE